MGAESGGPELVTPTREPTMPSITLQDRPSGGGDLSGNDLMPYAAESERALVGGVLCGWNDHLTALAELAEDDLGELQLRRLLPILRDLVDRGVIPTAPAVLDELRRTGDVSYRDGTAGPFLADVVALACWPGVAWFELTAILRARWRRRIVEAGVRLVQFGPDSSDEVLAALVESEYAAVRGAGERLLRAEAGR